ncbi:MAG: glycosyltransferase family 4 protein [Candidatus Pacebacteria bacterium]|nr:glycosyltransferase family 4 protein [Candidatus Paceibacterota bacterium]
MKIGVDIRSLMDKNFSGVSTFTYNLLLNLLKIDSKNQYVFYYNSLTKVKLPEFSDKVKIIKTSYPNKVFNYFLQKTFSYPKIDKYMGGLDLFFAPHFNFFSLSPKVKQIITVHDLSFIRYPEFFSSRKNSWHQALNVKRILQQSDMIMTVSQNSRLDILELFSLEENKVKAVYSGIEDKFFQTSSIFELQRVRYNLSLPARFILSLATLEPRKNLEGLIKAYNIFRDKRPDLNEVKLVIAGAKGWRYQNIIKAWRESKFKDDIIFLGYVKNEDKKVLYTLAELFVFPSFYEGFGFPVLEAMASKTPVICSFNSSLPEIAGSSALLINPVKSEEIAWAIEQIASSSGLKDYYSQKGYQRSQNFSWQQSAEKYLETFNSF